MKKITYSIPRGDSRTLPLQVPVDTYSSGMSIFITAKLEVDNVLDDSTAPLRKTLTDADIDHTDAQYVYYTIRFTPSEMNVIDADTYRFEFELVSADALTVLTYPDPNIAEAYLVVTGDVGRRTT